MVSKTGDQGARDTICAALGLTVPQESGPKGQRPRMSPLILQINTADRRKNEVFGKIHVTKMLKLSKLETVDEAVAKLLEFAEYPKIFRWFQFPKALVVFVAHVDSPDYGAVYVYDRKQCVWLWVDFNDQNYGGYSPSEFDVLI